MFAALRPRTAVLKSNALAAARPALSTRTFHVSTRSQAGVNPQDKDKINAEPTEYSKSGSDADTAHEDTAFSRDKTRPEQQLGDKEGDSLEWSPANSEFGKSPRGKQDTSKSSPSESKTSSSSESSRDRTSGGGGAKKHGSSPAAGQSKDTTPKGAARPQQ